MDRIDLHVHSIASDGTFSSRELLAEAKRINLTTIAITDHDCVDGLDEGIIAASKLGIEFVPGVEITTLFENKRIEILGYFIDPLNERLSELLATMATSRAKRTPRILQRLEELGLPLTEKDLHLKTGEALNTVSRSRIGRAMVEKGHVKNLQQAFDDYLAESKPANVQMFLPDVRETIETIRLARGICVIPHSMGFWNKDLNALETAIKNLKKIGLQGIEVYYPYAVRYRGSRAISPEFVENGTKVLEELARAENMTITGGTDFHGDVGRLGDINIPDGTMDRFRSHAESILGKEL